MRPAWKGCGRELPWGERPGPVSLPRFGRTVELPATDDLGGRFGVPKAVMSPQVAT